MEDIQINEKFDNTIAKEILEKLLERVKITQEDKDFLGRPYTLESFYKSCFYNIDNTVNDLASCILWRQNECKKGMEKYLNLEDDSNIFLINKKTDKLVMYFCSFHGAEDLRTMVFKGIWMIEEVFKKRKYKTYDIVIECYKSKSSHYTDLSGIKYFIELFKKYYPFRIDKLYFINATGICYNLINITKPLLSPYMKDRVIPIKNFKTELSERYSKEIIEFFETVKNNEDLGTYIIAEKLGIKII